MDEDGRIESLEQLKFNWKRHVRRWSIPIPYNTYTSQDCGVLYTLIKVKPRTTEQCNYNYYYIPICESQSSWPLLAVDSSSSWHITSHGSAEYYVPLLVVLLEVPWTLYPLSFRIIIACGRILFIDIHRQWTKLNLSRRRGHILIRIPFIPQPFSPSPSSSSEYYNKSSSPVDEHLLVVASFFVTINNIKHTLKWFWRPWKWNQF